MKPSITSIVSLAFLCYIAYSMLTFATLFRRLECSDELKCYQNFLNKNPKMQLALFTSPARDPLTNEVAKVAIIRNFDYSESYQNTFHIDVPLKTRRNGTLNLFAIVALDDGSLDWRDFNRDGPTVIQRIPLSTYQVPKDQLYNLLQDSDEEVKKLKKKAAANFKPKTHLKTKIFITMLTDKASLSPQDVQNMPELAHMTRLSRKGEFLPMVQSNILKERALFMIEVTKNVTEFDLEFNYSPASVGKFRLIAHIENAMRQLTHLGFTTKDIDEMKEIFADANLYLLLGTVFIGSIHTLFDFLSFKNDVSFWRKKKNYAGLSVRATIWRAFSTIIIFLYLLDEKSSLLILVPTGIGAIIELWKCKKILRMDISLTGIKLKGNEEKKFSKAEEVTNEIDRQGMKYLSYVLYPLCVGYAVYSLIYHPHKSWYSWTINSLVNGVYAFGFLFMCPQLFINYKLKSVAALPWRAFMYKAFNTFIDDVFAFIITMPTSHRVACFRDDIVFLIYLYQRWLYPVDKTRVDLGASMVDNEEYEAVEGEVKEVNGETKEIKGEAKEAEAESKKKK